MESPCTTVSIFNQAMQPGHSSTLAERAIWVSYAPTFWMRPDCTTRGIENEFNRRPCSVMTRTVAVHPSHDSRAIFSLSEYTDEENFEITAYGSPQPKVCFIYAVCVYPFMSSVHNFDAHDACFHCTMNVCLTLPCYSSSVCEGFNVCSSRWTSVSRQYSLSHKSYPERCHVPTFQGTMRWHMCADSQWFGLNENVVGYNIRPSLNTARLVGSIEHVPGGPATPLPNGLIFPAG